MRLNFLICLMLLSCLFSISCASVDQPSAVEVERVQIGNYHSRALFGAALDQKKLSKKPLVILIPGSGPNGPESFMPPELTLDHQNHPLLTEFAWPLRQAGFHTLQLGKPGVDYGYDENNANKFYDLAMVKSVTWNDLILNLKNAVVYAKNRPDVDASHIYILGHSQGTQVAVDYANRYKDVSGLLLLGFSGEDLKTMLSWQLFHRTFDLFIKPEVDANHDGMITASEAEKYPGIQFGLSKKKTKISIRELEKMQLNSKPLQEVYNSMALNKNLADVFARGPMYADVLKLEIPIFVFTGALDVQTGPETALKLDSLAKQQGKKNIQVTLVSGLGHGFSEPRAPRKHKLLDLTLGPVDARFQRDLKELAQSLILNRN